MGIGLLILLAIIQAATEFIPVSSSGHLFVVRELFGAEDTIAVDVVLHFATLLSLVWVFRYKIYNIIKDVKGNAKLIIALVVGSVPAALFGFFFDDFIETSVRNVGVVALMLVLIGLIMIFEDKLFSGNRKYEKISPSNALVVGIFQMLALIPGTSRSGITMIGSRFVGMSNRAAAEFSFLLGIPIIFGATLKILLIDKALAGFSDDAGNLLLAGLLATITGVIVLRFLIEFVSRKGLKYFGWYRIILAFILVITLGV